MNKLAPTTSAGPVHGFATLAGGELEQIQFLLVTFPLRQPNDISVANSAFKVPPMTKSE
jgi:hypothetical protein